MADTKLTALTLKAVPDDTDLVYLVSDPSGSPVARKTTAAAFKGADGADGADGATGATGAAGADGSDGADGAGVAAGGTTGQILAKVDDTDYNTEWIDETGGGIAWSDSVNADIVPDGDGTRDLGSATNRFANLHVDSIDLNGTTIDGTTSSSTVTLNAQTGTSYTLVLADAGKKVTMANASSNVLTIPTNASVAFPVGTILGVSQTGAGVTSITGDTGVTVNGVSASTGAIAAAYSGVTLTKLATDTWLAEGNVGAFA